MADNPARTTMRSLCFQRGERRKDERRQAQAEREKVNRELRSQGLPTPWQQAKAARKAKRDEELEVSRRRGRWLRARGVSAA